MTRRDEILEVICDYADAHSGNSPSLGDLLREMRKRGYKMSDGTLYIHVIKLQAENRLERRDGKLIVVGSDWLSPDEVNNPQIKDLSDSNS